MVQTGQGTGGEGNTNSPRDSASKYWCFTWNNYPDGAIEDLVKVVQKHLGMYLVGKEIGESGTPHLQGFLEFPERLRWTAFGLPKEIHWEKRKGSRAANIRYCTKGHDYYSNIPCVPECVRPPMLSGWQLEGCRRACEPADARSIHWYWSSAGGTGKSSMARYLCMVRGAIVTAGKCGDMKYQVSEYVKAKGFGPKIIIVDVPRSSHQFLSYSGLEQLKNGLFASNKYESGMVIINHPQLIVFANYPPDMNNEDLSADRLKVFEVGRGAGSRPVGQLCSLGVRSCSPLTLAPRVPTSSAAQVLADLSLDQSSDEDLISCSGKCCGFNVSLA